MCLILAVPDRGGLSAECDALVCSGPEVGRDLRALRLLLNPEGPVRQALMVTDGPRGASLLTGADEAVVPAPSVPVIDTTGAGDAFAAGVIRHLVGGGTWRGVLEEGMLWGAATVQMESSMPQPWRPASMAWS